MKEDEELTQKIVEALELLKVRINPGLGVRTSIDSIIGQVKTGLSDTLGALNDQPNNSCLQEKYKVLTKGYDALKQKYPLHFKEKSEQEYFVKPASYKACNGF